MRVVMQGLFAGASPEFKAWVASQMVPPRKTGVPTHSAGCRCGMCLHIRGEKGPKATARTVKHIVSMTPALWAKVAKAAKARGMAASDYMQSVLERVHR